MKYAYVREIWEFGDTKEVEEKHTGKYGAPGQKREKKKKASPEDIKRQNQWKRVRDIRRLIKWNFKKNDYWVTLTYKKGSRPTYQEIMGDVQKFIPKVQRRYKKQGITLKYIYRIAIGKRGGAHVHILVNRFSNEKTASDLIISECWECGHVNFTTTYDFGGFKELAEYIAKPLEEWEPEQMTRYHPSRDLIRKEPEKKVISRRSLVDKNGFPKPPKAPKGYYVDPDSIKTGINQVTGYPYRHYTLVKINGRE